jgi:hypothetical protein
MNSWTQTRKISNTWLLRNDYTPYIIPVKYTADLIQAISTSRNTKCLLHPTAMIYF